MGKEIMDRTKTEYCNMINILVCIAMFILPFVHFAEELIDYDVVLSTTADELLSLIVVIQNPAIFMIVIGYRLGKRGRSAKIYFRKGLIFLKIALIFDFFRWILSSIVALICSGESQDYFRFFAVSDIYIFVALVFFSFAFFKKINAGNVVIGIISIGLFIIYLIVVKKWDGCETFVISEILGWFVYTGEYCAFPLFECLIFPVIGYFAALYINKDKELIERRKKTVGICSLLIFLISHFILLQDIVRIDYGYSYKFVMMIPTLGLTGALICLVKIPADNVVAKWLDNGAAIIMPFYLIHYIIAVYVSEFIGIFLIEKVIFNLLSYLVISILISVLSYVLAKKYGIKLMKKLMKNKIFQ